MPFEKLWRLSEEKRSRLIVALDDDHALRSIDRVLGMIKHHAVGVKLGHKAFFLLGASRISSIISEWKDDFYLIADLKLADIPYINEVVGRELKEMGFDAATMHLFQRGIEGIRRHELPEIIGILAMSHKSSLLDSAFSSNVMYAKRLKLSGVVVGALKRTLIRRAKRSGFVVFSPGIGAQGGKDAVALSYGADFEIVGRRLISSTDVYNAVAEYVEKQRAIASFLRRA